MTDVYVGIGSNLEPRENILRGIELLRQRFGDVSISPIYESPAVGFEGPPFWNLVATFWSDLQPLQIFSAIQHIEDECGRDRDAEKWSSRTLDIDLLLCGDQCFESPRLKIPRADILEYAFVLKPLAELAPDRKHPVTGKKLRKHWKNFDGDRELTEVSLDKSKPDLDETLEFDIENRVTG